MRQADFVIARGDCERLTDEGRKKVKGGISELELTIESTCPFSMKHNQPRHKLMKYLFS
jgi:hypothetical protein